MVANVRVRENRHGQIYDMGKPYPQVIRENILDLHNNGLSVRQISAQARVSTGFITKVIKEYNENNYSVPRRALSGCKESVLTENVRSYLEVEKLCKLSSYSNQLQSRLLLDGVCLPGEIPSTASVRRFFNKELIMTRKKITQVPGSVHFADPQSMDYPIWTTKWTTLMDSQMDYLDGLPIWNT